MPSQPYSSRQQWQLTSAGQACQSPGPCNKGFGVGVDRQLMVVNTSRKKGSEVGKGPVQCPKRARHLSMDGASNRGVIRALCGAVTIPCCWSAGSSAALRLIGWRFSLLPACSLGCSLGGSLACLRHCGLLACCLLGGSLAYQRRFGLSPAHLLACSLGGSLVAKGVVARCKSARIPQSPFLLLSLHCATYVVHVVLLFFGFADAWCSS